MAADAGPHATGSLQVITGLQTLRVIALAAALAFPILIVPAAFVGSGTMFRFPEELPWLALMLIVAVGAGVVSRYVDLREPSGGSAQEVAISYRNRFFAQAAIGVVPSAVAFLLAMFVRPFPGLAVIVGVGCTVLLVVLVAPTERTLDKLQDQARSSGVREDVRSALDDLYSWRP